MEVGVLLDGRKWIRGTVKLEKNDKIYIDTITGDGVDKICAALDPFVVSQSYKFAFPGLGQDDLAQEIRMLIIEAIPSFNPNKNMGILGFLRGHARNRIINMCSFVSKQKRIATHDVISRIKTRCPGCRNFSTASTRDEYFECPRCGYTAMMDDSKIKKYNFPVDTINSSALGNINKTQGEWDEASTWIDSVSDSDANYIFGRAESISAETVAQIKLDLEKVKAKMSDKDREALRLALEGRVSRRREEKIFAKLETYLEE